VQQAVAAAYWTASWQPGEHGGVGLALQGAAKQQWMQQQKHGGWGSVAAAVVVVAAALQGTIGGRNSWVRTCCLCRRL
jgi:hypothetical protein